MKKTAALMIISIVLSFNKTIAQKRYPIYIDVLNQNYLPYKLNQWDTLKLANGNFAYIYLIDYRGSMYFKLSKKNKIISEGKYLNSLDTLKHYVESYSPIDGVATLEVSKYFSPIKDSTWLIFDLKTKKSIKQNFVRGIR